MKTILFLVVVGLSSMSLAGERYACDNRANGGRHFFNVELNFFSENSKVFAKLYSSLNVTTNLYEEHRTALSNGGIKVEMVNSSLQFQVDKKIEIFFEDGRVTLKKFFINPPSGDNGSVGGSGFENYNCVTY